jgi:DNA-binding winged helix-turn-helix (wHTH) protein
MYGPEDSLTFIRYLSQKWDVKINTKTENKILADCGGHFWFIKEAMRHLTANRTINYGTEAMQFRIRSVYDSLLPIEKNVLKKIVLSQKISSPEENYTVNYFRKINFVDPEGHCLIRLYEDFFLNRKETSFHLNISEDKIELNQIPLDRLFSRKEHRVIRYLLEKQDNLVSRDDIAKCIWPVKTMENYSDWAIDQIIARIRKRLKELSLPPSIVRTIRGQGFQLSLK